MTGLTAFNDFDKLFVGFDRLNRELANRIERAPVTNYPRYNIVAVGKEAYRIEMALPGWSKDDIEIKQHKNKLTIESPNLKKKKISQRFLEDPEQKGNEKRTKTKQKK